MRRNFFSEEFVRVISGSARGLKLNTPSGINTRPTLDRVKEALFSMLLPYLDGAVVLDLFAGSGSLGIEALSRGADKSYFIDSSNDAIECINSNILAAKFKDCSIVIKTTAANFLKNTSQKFDIIFIDPPYAKGMYADVLNIIAKNRLLSDEGFIIAEWDYEIGFTDELCSFEIFKEKKYGRVGITVLKWG